jgi:hypothetical protein
MVNMSGTGTVPVFAVVPDPLLFGNQPVSKTSAAADVTVTNKGSADLVFGAGAVSLSGADAALFAVVADGCSGKSVAPFASCVVSVSFSPKVAGSASAALTFVDSALDSPQSVVVSGVGTLAGFQAAPSPVAFGDQAISHTAPARTVTVTNTGEAALTFGAGAVTVGGANPSLFKVTGDGCSGQVLAKGGTCQVSVNFTPDTTGAKGASLVFADSAPGSPHVVALSGNGTPPDLGANQPNANAAAGAPGTAVVVIGGQRLVASVVKDPGSGLVTVTGGSWVITFQGIDSAGNTLPLADDGSMLVPPGSIINVTGTGFQANQPVKIWLFSDPVLLTTTTSGADGSINVPVTIPAGTAPGAHVLQVNGVVPVNEVGSASLVIRISPSVSIRAYSVHHANHFKVKVTPFCSAQYKFRVQKRIVTRTGGSDDPVTTVTWRTLPKTYKTTGKKTSTKDINLPRGTYRAVVRGACGYAGGTSNTATLKR